MSRTVKRLLIIALVLIGVRYYYQLPVYMRKIVLTDSPAVVEANMRIILCLCQKLDRRNGVSIYVRNTPDSTLIINGIAYGAFAQATAHRLEGDPILRNLSAQEIDQFLASYGVLKRNLVDAVYYSIDFRRWVFSYGYDVRYNEFTHQRFLFLIDKPALLSSPLFVKYFTVVDRKEKLVLMSPKNIRE